MRYSLRWTTVIVLALLTLAGRAWAAEDKGGAGGMVIPLKVEQGKAGEVDDRVFSVPVTCNGVKADFTWGCGGWTILSASFAGKCGLTAKPDPDVADLLDGSGQPIFTGGARAEIFFGDQAHKVDVKIMRDEYAGTSPGILGYQVARRFQFELNPDAQKPTLTLRPLGTPIEGKRVAVLGLKDDEATEQLLLGLKARGVVADVPLAPQSSDIQAAPDLQKKWDLASTRVEEVRTYMGVVRMMVLRKKDSIELAPGIREEEVRVILAGDVNHPERTPAARSGVGATFLNRFVYCVDPKLKQFVVLARRGAAATQPAPAPSPGTGKTQGPAPVKKK